MTCDFPSDETRFQKYVQGEGKQMPEKCLDRLVLRLTGSEEPVIYTLPTLVLSIVAPIKRKINKHFG